MFLSLREGVGTPSGTPREPLGIEAALAMAPGGSTDVDAMVWEILARPSQASVAACAACRCGHCRAHRAHPAAADTRAEF